MIYWDNNATTPLAPEVLESMLPYLREQYFNPSAAYAEAKAVRRALGAAREQVAALLGVEPDEIIFTSGATEATNSALRAAQRCLCPAIEHPATLRSLGAESRAVIAPVTPEGEIDAEAWARLLPGCDAASLAWVNHETGVIQAVGSLARAAAQAGVRVHVDLVQAAGKIPLALHEHPISFASLSAHKFHGPKGVGALYVRRGTPWKPLLLGGGQEDYRRAGTENVAGIIGMGRAAELARDACRDRSALEALRTRFLTTLRAAGIEPVLNGGGASSRLPQVLNLRIPGISAESLSLLLEAQGVLCAAGSACTSAEPEPSHVLRAMGIPDAAIRESLRLSFNRYSSAEEIDRGADIFIRCIRKIRSVQSTRTGPVTVYR